MTPAGRELLLGRDLARRVAPSLGRRPLLLVADFDGTLSALVMDPWAARVIPAAQRALRRLAGMPGVHVALLSGRAAPDLASRVRVGGAHYLGNHGVERGHLARRARAESLASIQDPALAPYEADAERIATGMAELVAEPWLVVERKGPAVAFHYRAAPDVAAAGDRVAAAADRLDPGHRFARFRGRRILELRPPEAGAKGEAVEALVDELSPAVAYVLGDDASDAEAFRILRALRDAGRLDGLAIGVAARPELPEPVLETADVVLASPEECARFLSAVAKQAAPRSRSDSRSGPRVREARCPTGAPSRRPPRS